MDYKVEKMEMPWGVDSLYGGKDNAGSGIIHTSEKEGVVRATALACPDRMLSKLAQGFDTQKANMLKGDASALVYSIFIIHLQRLKASIEDEWEQIEMQIRINQIARLDARTSGRVASLNEIFKSGYHEKVVGDAFNQALKHGAKGVQLLANLIKSIEKKSKFVTQEEGDFLKCVALETEKANKPPAQRDVRESWLKMCPDKNENAWHDKKKKLGFEWLPTAKDRRRVVR
jgi:hypothetical protein